jgi:hypothetical protein
MVFWDVIEVVYCMVDGAIWICISEEQLELRIPKKYGRKKQATKKTCFRNNCSFEMCARALIQKTTS